MEQHKQPVSHSRLYRMWANMKARCNNPNSTSYKYYGAKGIGICIEWNDFEPFAKWATENGYDESAKRGKTTLDRIDAKGDYCPENCRIVDSTIQSFNRDMKRGKYPARGVRPVHSGHYQVFIGKNYKKIYLGTFMTLDDALLARRDAEMKYYGTVLDV